MMLFLLFFEKISFAIDSMWHDIAACTEKIIHLIAYSHEERSLFLVPEVASTFCFPIQSDDRELQSNKFEQLLFI